MHRYYLDQAATSWPKSPQVLDAVSRYLREDGAAAGRGSYSSALVSMNWVDRARIAIAKLINAPAPADIALMSSGTHALNEAILGTVRPGDHVITTAIEHNSVLRPLERLRQDRIIDLDIAPCNHLGWVDPEDVVKLRRVNTKLLALSHASNVTGMIQEIEPLGQWCRTNDVCFLVDAAQSIGYVPIDVMRLGVDYLAAPGHKGLGGILGTGLLYLSKSRQAHHRPLLSGGTGSQSESLVPDLTWPHKVEPGNLNVPGIVSLAVAVELLLQDPAKYQGGKMQADWARLRKLLTHVPNLRLHAGDNAQQYVSVLSCTHSSLSPTDMAAILDAEFQVEVRAGLHCAALIHSYLDSANAGTVNAGTVNAGTVNGGTVNGGTVRFSFGHELDPQIEAVLEKVVEALSQC
jgi:cysteine desulfurase/selenocysteine lyase